MLQVEQVRPVKTRWHVMSLAVLNEDRDLGEKYNALMKKAWGPVRVCVAAARRQREGGDGVDARSENEVLVDLYTALGNLAHPGGKRLELDVVAAGARRRRAARLAGRRLRRAPTSTTRSGPATRTASSGSAPTSARRSSRWPARRSSARSSPRARRARTPAGSGTGCWRSPRRPGFYELKRTRDERPMFD